MNNNENYRNYLETEYHSAVDLLCKNVENYRNHTSRFPDDKYSITYLSLVSKLEKSENHFRECYQILQMIKKLTTDFIDGNT